MKYNFRLPDFPNDNFEMETNAWTGRMRLFKNNIPVEQLRERGKPFLIPTTNKEVVKAFPKPSFPDMVPQLAINGIKHRIADKLTPLQYIVGAIPLLLIFLGGAIGGGIGVAATLISYNIFRQAGAPSSKWGKVAGVIIGAYVLYSVIAVFVVQLFYR